jgi:hypothetical protein
MQLPFTATQFVEVFARYNAAVWPVAILAYLAGITAVVFAIKPSGKKPQEHHTSPGLTNACHRRRNSAGSRPPAISRSESSRFVGAVGLIGRV